MSMVSDDGSADALTKIIMRSLMDEGGLTREQIAEKDVCFGAYGVSTFQGCTNGVSTQIREKWAPFVLTIHCMSHRFNLCLTFQWCHV